MSEHNDAIQHVYEAAQDLENVDPEFLDVIETYHEFDNITGDALPQYRVFVKIEDDKSNHMNTYCYPIADYAREEWGLFLFDTVTDWEEQIVTLRFGYNVPESRVYTT